MRQGTRLLAGVLVAVATAGAAVALGVALLLGNIVHLRSSANATLRTGAYLEATISLEGLVVDAETGLRGYVITGRSLFLAPERAAAAQRPAAGAGLERAAANDGEFVPMPRELAASAGSYIASYVPEVIRDVTSDPTAARSYRTTAEGKALVDGIRTQTARLERLISSRQNARQRADRDSANTAVTVAVVALVVLTLLTVALVGILGWLLLGCGPKRSIAPARRPRPRFSRACCRPRSPTSRPASSRFASRRPAPASWSEATSTTCSRWTTASGRSSSATCAGRGRRRPP